MHPSRIIMKNALSDIIAGSVVILLVALGAPSPASSEQFVGIAPADAMPHPTSRSAGQDRAKQLRAAWVASSPQTPLPVATPVITGGDITTPVLTIGDLPV